MTVARASLRFAPLLLTSCAFAASLHIEVRDEKGALVWTRLEVRNAAGEEFQAPGSFHENMRKARGGKPFYLGSFIVHGVAEMSVPAGAYTVIAEHGLEYERIEREIQVTEEAPARLSLRMQPWTRMREKGWWSGDMHVHRNLEDAPAVAQAEDLNFSVLVNRGKADLFRADHWPAQSLQPAGDNYWLSLRNVEDERRGGSWILNGLAAPLTLGREGGWFPSGLTYVREALAQRSSGGVLPWFDIDMSFWWEVPVMVALQPPDSLDILHNQFMQYGIDQSEYWGHPRDRAQYPGTAGFVDYCMDLYYRYLNLGFRIPPSAGTGTGVMPSPAGYDRVYAQIDGPFTLEKWYTAIREGRSFVTNGPMLFVTNKLATGTASIDASAQSREPIDRMELIANGRIIATRAAPLGARSMTARFTLDPRRYSWCAVRCFLRTPDNIRMAHSAPIYLPGKYDATADAEFFVAWLDQLTQQTLKDESRFTDTAQRDQILANYAKAREIYREKIYRKKSQ
jgi:hypothetical protein